MGPRVKNTPKKYVRSYKPLNARQIRKRAATKMQALFRGKAARMRAARARATRAKNAAKMAYKRVMGNRGKYTPGYKTFSKFLR